MMIKKTLDFRRLKIWFAAEKRDLPWRYTKDPYAIWISEVMLQQTQAAVVCSYFLRWMQRFPTIQYLAEASLDEVLKAWEGLGYYSRARHLHEGAKYILEHFDGQLPYEEEKLKKIKGLGPYTIGAILSFAFHQKKAAVDGNVLRVLSRYFALKEDIAKSTTIHHLRQIAQEILPDEEPWLVNEALIELGAMICQRKARCTICPLQQTCQAFHQGLSHLLPIKSKKASTEYLYRVVAIIQYESHYLVKKGKRGEIMSDLYEFPYFETSPEEMTAFKLQKEIETNYPLQVVQKQILPSVTHGFTRYQVQLYPVWYTCHQPNEIKGLEWLSQDQLKQLAFSSGHRRIFQQILADPLVSDH